MTDSRTALAPADTDPLTPTPRRRAVLPCWQHLLGEGTLLGLFVWTIRALHEQGAPGRVGHRRVLGRHGHPAALDLYGRFHGSLPPTAAERQVEVGRPTDQSVAPDTARVLSGLAALGYDGIAGAIRQALQQTGLAPHELGMRLGLPPDALVLWAQGSFIPRTCHLLRLGALLADHPPKPPGALPPST